MLATDVALAAAPRVDCVVAMSGVLLVDSVPALAAPNPIKPRFLLSRCCSWFSAAARRDVVETQTASSPARETCQ